MRKKDNFIVWISIILMWVLIFAVAIGYGIILAEYGDKPITEVPVWVLWLLRRGR